MHDIVVGILTADRTPKTNYLGKMLANLHRSGVFKSERLHSLRLFDSGIGRDEEWLSTILKDAPFVEDGVAFSSTPNTEGRFCANENTARLLKVSAQVGAPWVLFLEDDIDVCEDFLGSVGRWLDRHACFDRKVYAFGANYPQANGEQPAWDYPVGTFYGTQAFAIRPLDALDLAKFISERVYVVNKIGAGYDMLMQRWAKSKGITFFLASAPSFVQHIGKDSTVGSVQFGFPSWRGRGWKYE